MPARGGDPQVPEPGRPAWFSRTGDDGCYTFQGFLGRHRVSVKDGTGRAATGEMTVARDSDNRLVVRLAQPSGT
mgnify:CR=1 FL=1